MARILRTILFGRYRTWSWALLLALIYWGVISQWSSGAAATAAFDEFARSAVAYLPIIVPGVLLVVGFGYWRARRRYLDLVKDFKFSKNPALFDRHLLRLTLRVVRVLPEAGAKKGNRKSKRRGAGRQLRFLGSSPYLRRGENLVVVCDADRLKIKLRKGQYIVVQGQYFHDPGSRRGMFGIERLHYYGKLLYPHAPRGGIRQVSKRDKLIAQVSSAQVSSAQVSSDQVSSNKSSETPDTLS